MSAARAIPSPNASNPKLLMRLVDLVAQGIRSTRGLHEALGVEQRTVQYYVQAAMWMGLLGGEGDAELTPLGLELAYAGKDRPQVYARAVFAVPFVAALVQRIGGPPTTEALRAAVRAAEPDLAPATLDRRASAIKSLLAPALGKLPSESQLALPLGARPSSPTVARIEAAAGREYNPDVHRLLLAAVIDHGELSLGQVRAFLDASGVRDAPLGGYVDLLIGRGEATRQDERLVVTHQAAARREIVESTASVVLSDPGFRAWLADAREAAGGSREAEVRRDRLRGRYRAWERRLFGREIDPMRVEAELRRVLIDRSLENFAVARAPGTPAEPVREPFLDCWEKTGLLVSLPPSLAMVRRGLAAVNQVFHQARQGGDRVALPDVAVRPLVAHGGLVHPGEPLPRAIPDMRTLRLRMLVHAPYVAMVAAILWLHRTTGRFTVTVRGDQLRLAIGDVDAGDLLVVLDGFAVERGWVPSRRRIGGLSGAELALILESAGIAAAVGRRLVLAERLFVQLRTEPEEIEVHAHLVPLSEALEGSLG